MAVAPTSGPNADWALNRPGGSTFGGGIIMGRGPEELGVDDFFNLMAAQLRNQDMFNPQSDTDFIAQMAQFTSLRAVQMIQESQLASYATSFAGKHVTIAHTDNSGNLTRTEGVVSRVTFYDGEPRVIVNNIAFPLFAVMEVHDPRSSDFETPPTTTPPTGDGTTPPPAPDLIRIPDLNTAASFIGRTVTMRIPEPSVAGGFYEVTGVVTGATRNQQGQILFTIDDEYDYNVAYMIGVRQTVTNDDED